MRRCHDQKVISGPLLLVDEILRLCSASNINELVSAKWKGDIYALSIPRKPRRTYMYLRKRPASSLVTSRIFCSPRIGLDLSNQETRATSSHPRVVFVGKLYRRVTHPELFIANGRAKTFVGLLLTVVALAEVSQRAEQVDGNQGYHSCQVFVGLPVWIREGEVGELCWGL